MSRMKVDVKVGETLTVGGVNLTLESKSGQLARLVVQAPDHVEVETPKQKKARMSVLHNDDMEHTDG